MRTVRVDCSPDGESTKSASSKSTQVSFPPCYKSHSHKVTCSEPCIPTYRHTAVLTFSSGVKFQDYLREKILSIIWQWLITGWPWPPPRPTHGITSLRGHLGPSIPFPLAPPRRHLSPLPGLLLIYLPWSLHLISLSVPFIPSIQSPAHQFKRSWSPEQTILCCPIHHDCL